MANWPRVLIGLSSAACAALAAIAVQCASPEGSSGETSSGAAAHADVAGNRGDVLAAWDVVYRVLQHPRCLNCHPAGDAPLQGDDSHAHAQLVQRGKDGTGVVAMRCDTCHQTQNLPGSNLPPGAPNWHLPSPDMPLVFEGRNSRDLCRQMQDPKRNGGKTVEQILEHVAHDPLVAWGWSPGEGRAPVPIPHDQVVSAMRAWIDGGCACPE